MLIIHDLKTRRFWRNYGTRAFACFGGIAVVIQTNAAINPDVTAIRGFSVLFTVVLLSLVGGLIWSWPRPISQEYNAPKTRIRIVKGDLLDEATHLVIGTVDTFDTEPPSIIALDSLQGQALQKLYGSDLKELDAQLATALADKPTIGVIEKAGKKQKYGVGTIATVKHASRLIFFLAYCEMDAHNNAHSTPDKLWNSLGLLWDEISRRANGGAVSMPVIGGGQARLSSIVPAQDAIRFTLLSFMFASRTKRICEELTIVVRPDEYKGLDRLELQAFLSSLRSS